MSSRDRLIEKAERRANSIDAYVESHDANTGMVMNAFQSRKIEPVQVIEIERRYLRLNPNNGRFTAELDIIRKDRKDAGRPAELDPDNEDDLKTLMLMLKGEYPPRPERRHAYSLLRDNIQEVGGKTGTNGQEQPGLITHDGILINGNRRWVVMEDLAAVDNRQRGNPLQYNTMKVGRLKKGVDAYELWKNEAKEQISQESREEYDYVNSALEIKRGYEILKNQGHTDAQAKEEIAKTLYGRTRKDVESYLRFLDIADLFLEQIGKRGQYRFLQDTSSGEEKGITSILQEISDQREKFLKMGWQPEMLAKWFKAVSLFGKFSKDRPAISDNETRKLPFTHREYRQFNTKVMGDDHIREKFLNLELFDSMNVGDATASDARSFYEAIKIHEDEFDVKKNITSPISLLEKAKNSLSKVSEDLQGSYKNEKLRVLKDNHGRDHVSEIITLAKDILQKIG